MVLDAAAGVLDHTQRCEEQNRTVAATQLIRNTCFCIKRTRFFNLNAAAEVLDLMQRGAENRTVAATQLNKESSRSHSVFTCMVQLATRDGRGVTETRHSRLTLVDLAGRKHRHLCRNFQYASLLAS